MGLREWANGHPKTVSIVVGACALACVGGIVAEVMGNRHRYPTEPPDSYFSVNDGKTYFVASSANYPPFDHDGQQAVHAYVFQCDGKKFVGFLERFTPDAKKKLAAGAPLSAEMMRFGREIKRPGDAKWTRTGDMATETKIENVTCPDGNGTPEEIEP